MMSCAYKHHQWGSYQILNFHFFPLTLKPKFLSLAIEGLPLLSQKNVVILSPDSELDWLGFQSWLLHLLLK